MVKREQLLRENRQQRLNQLREQQLKEKRNRPIFEVTNRGDRNLQITRVKGEREKQLARQGIDTDERASFFIQAQNKQVIREATKSLVKKESKGNILQFGGRQNPFSNNDAIARRLQQEFGVVQNVNTQAVKRKAIQQFQREEAREEEQRERAEQRAVQRLARAKASTGSQASQETQQRIENVLDDPSVSQNVKSRIRQNIERAEQRRGIQTGVNRPQRFNAAQQTSQARLRRRRLEQARSRGDTISDDTLRQARGREATRRDRETQLRGNTTNRIFSNRNQTVGEQLRNRGVTSFQNVPIGARVLETQSGDLISADKARRLQTQFSRRLQQARVSGTLAGRTQNSFRVSTPTRTQQGEGFFFGNVDIPSGTSQTQVPFKQGREPSNEVSAFSPSEQRVIDRVRAVDERSQAIRESDVFKGATFVGRFLGRNVERGVSSVAGDFAGTATGTLVKEGFTFVPETALSSFTASQKLFAQADVRRAFDVQGEDARREQFRAAKTATTGTLKSLDPRTPEGAGRLAFTAGLAAVPAFTAVRRARSSRIREVRTTRSAVGERSVGRGSRGEITAANTQPRIVEVTRQSGEKQFFRTEAFVRQTRSGLTGEVKVREATPLEKSLDGIIESADAPAPTTRRVTGARVARSEAANVDVIDFVGERGSFARFNQRAQSDVQQSLLTRVNQPTVRQLEASKPLLVTGVRNRFIVDTNVLQTNPNALVATRGRFFRSLKSGEGRAQSVTNLRRANRFKQEVLQETSLGRRQARNIESLLRDKKGNLQLRNPRTVRQSQPIEQGLSGFANAASVAAVLGRRPTPNVQAFPVSLSQQGVDRRSAIDSRNTQRSVSGLFQEEGLISRSKSRQRTRFSQALNFDQKGDLSTRNRQGFTFRNPSPSPFSFGRFQPRTSGRKTPPPPPLPDFGFQRDDSQRSDRDRFDVSRVFRSDLRSIELGKISDELPSSKQIQTGLGERRVSPQFKGVLKDFKNVVNTSIFR